METFPLDLAVELTLITVFAVLLCALFTFNMLTTAVENRRPKTKLRYLLTSWGINVVTLYGTFWILAWVEILGRPPWGLPFGYFIPIGAGITITWYLLIVLKRWTLRQWGAYSAEFRRAAGWE
ncbi:MAG: hypothetical protein HKM24_05485 [Gammaproteobacteria bacterium]|nr:hypothetical protein [Gammaproteobacteria bacterium]